MSKTVCTVDSRENLATALKTMVSHDIGSVVVTEGGRPSGIVTERDLLKWVVRVTYEPNIPEEIKKLIAQNP